MQFGFQKQKYVRAFLPSRQWEAAAREIPTAHADTTFPVKAGPKTQQNQNIWTQPELKCKRLNQYDLNLRLAVL